MASIRERRRADGTRSWAVLWRDPDTGRQTSLTYDDERDARVARELIEAAAGPGMSAGPDGAAQLCASLEVRERFARSGAIERLLG